MYILGLDLGTTGSTCLILRQEKDSSFTVVGKANQEFPQHYPKLQWVEHDLDEMWEAFGKAITLAFKRAAFQDAQFSVQKIASIGITNQRETLAIWEKKTAKPLRRAIVWQCKRSLEICQRLKKQGSEKEVREKTGLFVDPYFTGSKLLWVMENHPELATKLKNGEALAGTMDSYLIYRLTGGKTFATEASNASRTLLMSLKGKSWDPDLLSLFGAVHPDSLPEIRDSFGVFGTTLGASFLPDGLPITGCLGDQQAALFGQGCLKTGEAKCTYGTGAFLLVNAGPNPVIGKPGILTTVAWQYKKERTFALEGAAFIAGASVQFFRDNLGLIKTAAESEERAQHAVAAPELYFVPSLAGLGAPHWVPNARGAYLGLTRGTSSNELARAHLEAIAFSVHDLLQTMAASVPLTRLRVDGGACANQLLMQMQADISAIELERPLVIETTAYGAALAGALGGGLLPDIYASAHSPIEQTFTTDWPQNSVHRQDLLRGWAKAIAAVKVFAE